jgi:hypothetical protein
MAKAGRFVYRGRDRTTEDVSRRAHQSGGAFDSFINPDFQMFKPREGENEVRILPPTWEDIETYGKGWEVPIFLHRNIGVDGATYLCLNKMKGEPCPCCDARRDAADEEEADALKYGYRALTWMVDRLNEKAGPLPWTMGIKLFREINARSVDKKNGGVILIDDPEDGYDILFNREGSKKNTQYVAVEIARDPSPIHDDERRQNDWLDLITENPLPSLLVYHDYDYIRDVMFGKGGGEKLRRRVENSDKPGEKGEGAGAESGSRRGRATRAEPEASDEATDRSERAARRRGDGGEAPERGRRGERDEAPERGERTSARSTRRAVSEADDENPPSEGGRRPVRGERDNDPPFGVAERRSRGASDPDPERGGGRRRLAREPDPEPEAADEDAGGGDNGAVGRAREQLGRLSRRQRGE